MNEYIFLGDSITDCDHIYDSKGLGNGYVSLIASELKSEKNQFINLGYDGFTITALKRLWKRKASSLNPACITILIGINDVAVIKNTGLDSDFALEEFQMNYGMLIENIRKYYVCPIILIEPFIFPKPAEFLTWEPEVKKMNAIIEKIARKYDLHFLPVWERLSSYARLSDYNRISTDGVHLTQEGHSYLANFWLDFAKKSQII